MERVCPTETSECYLIQDGEKVQLAALTETVRSSFLDCALTYKDICAYKAQDDCFSFNFVGVVLANSTPIFVFPKNFSFSENSKSGKLADSARLLYNVLTRYKQDGKYQRESELYLAGKSSFLSNQIDAALNILNDYRENGILNPKSRCENLNGKTRVNWQKTISKCQPVFSDASPIYTSVVTRKWRSQQDNLLAKIHAAILTKASDAWGWLANVEVARTDRLSVLPISPHGAILFLTRELQRVYRQREINTINFLIQFLKSSSDERCSSISLFGTPHYMQVWEKICGYIFDNLYEELKSNIPQPKWTLDIDRQGDGKIRQIPDIFSVRAKTLYIFDAKYYNYENSLPGWPDIVKQFFYSLTIVSDVREQSIVKTLSLDEVFNVFLLPDYVAPRFSRIGSVCVQGNDELGNVEAMGINQNLAMWLYANRARHSEKAKFKEDFLGFLQKHCSRLLIATP